MDLGSSMRRRRPSRGEKQKKRPSRKRSRGKQLLESRNWQLGLLAVAAAILASGGGYLYATHVVFPGPERLEADLREVPDLRGMSYAEMETFLREQGFQINRVDSISHPAVPSGEILGQSPFPGQLLSASGALELTVSLGPERRPVPDVLELRADEALTVLQMTGFLVEVDSVESTVGAGRVVETDPEVGTELSLPSEVRLSVSLGPPLVEMPDLAGLQEDRAVILLDSLGLEVGEVETRFRFGFNQGEVLEHFPLADSLIPAGTQVRLVVGRRGLFPGP